MLISLVLELKNINFSDEINYLIYSWFFDQLKKINQEKSNFYHQLNKKPFTISPIYSFKKRNFLRFTFLNTDIFNLAYPIFLTNERIVLKNQQINIKQIYIKKSNDLPEIINLMIDFYEEKNSGLVINKCQVEFLTPTVIKKGDKFQVLPDEQSIINSFLEKQKEIYGKIIFPKTEFQIINHQLKTKKINLKPFYTYRGFIGKIIIKSNINLYHFVKPLSFFGLGMKTTMGLGQVVVKY